MKTIKLKYKNIYELKKQKFELYFYLVSNCEYFEFFLYFKNATYIPSLISFLIFIIFYYFDIRLFSYIYSQEFIQSSAEIIGLLLGLKEHIYIIFIIIIFLIIFFFFGRKQSKKEIMEGIIKMFYYRANFLINFIIFSSVFDIDIKSYLEYNFIFIIIILCLIIKQIFELLFLKKASKIIINHFLSLPYLTLSFSIILFLINGFGFFKIFRYIVGLDKKYYSLISKFKN